MIDPDRQQQAAPLKSLRRFARELEIPEETAVAVYERELLRLREGARADRFVHILAEKRAKCVLRTQGR